MRNNYVLLSLLAAVATPVFSHSTDVAKAGASQPEAKRWFGGWGFSGGRDRGGHHDGGSGGGFGSGFGNHPGYGNGRGNRGGYAAGFGGHPGDGYSGAGRGSNYNGNNNTTTTITTTTTAITTMTMETTAATTPATTMTTMTIPEITTTTTTAITMTTPNHHHHNDDGEYNDTSPVFTSDDPTAFTCNSAGYLVLSTTLYTVDLSSGSYTAVTNTLTDQTNAIGYNVRDNFLYGRQGPTGGPYNLRPVLHLASAGDPNTGDIDFRGYYWLSSSGGAWWKIDLRHPGDDTYGTVVDSGTADPLGYTIADWVYIPSAGRYLYAVGTKGGVQNTSTLLRFHLRGTAAYTWTVVRDFQVDGLLSGTWGAQYGANTGYVYASDNESGEIWRFAVHGSGADAVKEADGPTSGLNDGARWVWNLDMGGSGRMVNNADVVRGGRNGTDVGLDV
ncbi:hypothetical protein B0T22DRAFT_514406 [Podospora appendiculata]|uniref:DUF6923 domain-containing protein n=1 Tax=Podospora appendiculata TaxID=314037 RepID=A0AAE1CDL6_9PEZI|nr:hypothetical protein B0T22DRAFT_514406 [Podospora appendiculata]